MKDVKRFLELVTKRFPPIQRHAHSLVLRAGKLQLNLVTTAPCWQFVLNEADLQKTPEQLVTDIAKLMSGKDSSPTVA